MTDKALDNDDRSAAVDTSRLRQLIKQRGRPSCQGAKTGEQEVAQGPIPKKPNSLLLILSWWTQRIARR